MALFKFWWTSNEKNIISYEDIYNSYLMVIDSKNDNHYGIRNAIRGSTKSSTPWLDDFDGNNYLGVVHASVKFKVK